LFAVTPETWTTPPTATLTPVAVNVAVRAVTLVPKGAVTAMVLLASVIVPVAAGFVKENAIMALVVLGAVGGEHDTAARAATSVMINVVKIYFLMVPILL
jgi:hypothetical protein